MGSAKSPPDTVMTIEELSLSRKSAANRAGKVVTLGHGEWRGIEAFFQRKVLPHVPDAWIDHANTQIGYEISFSRHFCKPTPLPSLDWVKADLEALEAEAEGLLDGITAGGAV
ncbi:MAG: hypothetical protein GX547_15005 [Phycisphaerae bacterium]|jgi:hypothetical protein|nr:hypothetical protein [Phycisphaerae bacterium]